MNRMIKSLALVLCAAFASGSAVAAPALLYQFQTTGMSCEATDCTVTTKAREELDKMYIGLGQSALDTGSATLRVWIPYAGDSEPVINEGVETVSFYLYYSFLQHTAVPQHGYVYPAPNHQFWLEVFLTIGEQLTGSIDIDNTGSELVMWSNPDGLGWGGYISSDALSGGKIRFTGDWVEVHTVPEPGTVVLLLVALAGVAAVAKHRVHRAEFSRGTFGGVASPDVHITGRAVLERTA